MFDVSEAQSSRDAEVTTQTNAFQRACATKHGSLPSITWKLKLEFVRLQLPFDTDQSAQREPPTPSMKLDGPSTV
jgi:hypothetical protein